MARSSAQRPALGALFLLIAISFAGVAYAAAGAEVWVVAVAAAVLAIWLGSLAFRFLRPR